MINWRGYLVRSAARVLDAIQVLEQGTAKIALVIDEDDRLIGTVTDGDVRRGILAGETLQSPVTAVMRPDPMCGSPSDSRDSLRIAMRAASVRQLPIIDHERRIIGLQLLDKLEEQAGGRPNWVVLMAGGLGTRLHPLTESTPKPLLKVGHRPLLETILASFLDHGFSRFYLSVNYKAEMVKDHFGDGGQWNCDIQYLEEKDKLGTAGSLSLLPEPPADPLIVMNGDVLTNVNFESLLDYHQEHDAAATVCVREYDFQVPYGVINTEGNRIVSISEKPVNRFFVNAGIYVLAPHVLANIAPSGRTDMTTLLERLIKDGKTVTAFPIREYWLDIGRPADFDRANGEYSQVFPVR
jgi:dTDP-glucose pyrophosphorylase